MFRGLMNSFYINPYQLNQGGSFQSESLSKAEKIQKITSQLRKKIPVKRIKRKKS